ncbi:unnamed protein product [Acanthoscelides obtectus]|uniref:Uncharacterized protein n=1 Tax=Acanthoscelides obtectus TaxID=200917 RepID=A0A9P0KYH4_ACAOB|nr:unnamed protein product [Acanthoscelides obtectus]CAK1670214.1 PiggyBac transposable element-derived protein 3 [Acanthoscelides obtectus]
MDNYSYWNYWKRPMKLHELMAEIENIDDDELIPDTIAVLPPVNANEYNTDEDSGDENEVDINNLPGSQLMTEVEIVFENEGSNQTTVESDFDSDDLCLPFLRKNDQNYQNQVTLGKKVTSTKIFQNG